MIEKRKRGRPRKNQMIKNDISKLKNQTIKEDESIILHIPLLLNEIEDEKKNFKITELSTTSPEEKENIKKIKLTLKNKEKKIKQLEEDIQLLKENIKKYENIENIYNNVKQMKYKFIDYKTNKIIDIKENMENYCWHCTEKFSNFPSFIPEKMIDNEYYVFGCFCDDNCAAAYNMNMNDYKVWNRHSLLKKLNNEKFNTNDELLIAPAKECLKKYGGILDINTFRNSTKNNSKEYRIILPPMKAIIPHIEQYSSDNININNENINNNNYNNNNDNFNNNNDLILKRSKPIPKSKTNLLNTVNKLKNNIL